MEKLKMGKKFGVVVLVLQVVFLVLFALFTDYADTANAKAGMNSRDQGKNGTNHAYNEVKDYYPMFQDVHVMMFIGFGFLMTFLKRYGYSAIGFNMLIASFVIQWSLLMGGFLHMHDGTIEINITNLLTADFAAAAVLISFGALLGKTSPLQMIVVALIEIVIFSVNEYIGVELLGAVDVGGSMFVHVFGAYFGLAIARVIWTKDTEKYEDNQGSVYHSDLFSMIGTVFLWMYWPSFNSALAPGDDQHRAVINTYLALAACCVTTFVISALVNEEGKFEMEHLQNATLAGGVAVGTPADMMIRPWGAILIGILAGTLSTVGFKFIGPAIGKKLKVHDTCGVNNLHGMPGLFAGIVGCIAAAVASTQQYGYSLYQIFPERAPEANSTALLEIQQVFSLVDAGSGRTAGMQAAMQILALVVTFCIAIITGSLTGLLLKLPFFDQPKGKPLYDDSLWFEVPEDFGEEYKPDANGHKTDTLLQDLSANDKEA